MKVTTLLIFSLVFVYGCKPSQEATQYNITDLEVLETLPPDEEGEKSSHPPVAHNQFVTMLANTSKTFQFSLASDQDDNNEGFIYEIVEGPSSGSVSDCLLKGPIYSSLDCTYTPNTDFTGKDLIKYKVTDSDGLVSEQLAEVEITVFPVEVNCENERRLAIFLDNNKNGLIDEGEKLGEVSAFVGNISTADNYNYYSASAHPVHGPTPSGYQGNVFFYNGLDGLSLNFFFNVDGGGSSDNQVKWDISTSGNSFGDSILVADDPGSDELTEIGILGEWKNYQGDWHYWYNTDGGAIGPFIGQDFEIKVVMRDKGDVQDIKFYSVFSTENGTINDDIEIITSNMGPDAPDTFFIRYADSEICDYQ